MLRRSIPFLRHFSDKKPLVEKYTQDMKTMLEKMKPGPDVQRFMSDMDKKMESFEREFFKKSPFKFLTPRLMPVQGVPASDTKFRVEVDVNGYAPEDIQISLSEGKIKIEAKMDKIEEDGSRVQQQLLREFALPSNLDEKTVESFLHNSGVLSIEGVVKGDGGQKMAIDGAARPVYNDDCNEKGKNY